MAVILGYLAHASLTEATGINLPLFVPCLIMGILLSNTVPLIFPRLHWPAHTASLELVSSYALSIFLAMSLMSMQLWTLAGSAAALFIIVAVQTVVAAAYIYFVVFPALGRDYQAAVGLKGKLAGFNWDLSTTIGRNKNAFYTNSLNASSETCRAIAPPRCSHPDRCGGSENGCLS